MTFDYDTFIQKHAIHWTTPDSTSREKFCKYIVTELVKKNKPLFIVETGTMWTKIEEDAGAFTYLFADLIKNYTGGKLITIDISEEAIQKCRENTAEFADVIMYVTSDSVEFLKKLGRDASEVDAFFFDSYDLNVKDPLPSSIHHFRELLAVYDHLSDDVLIGVDDNFLPGTFIHWNWYSDTDGSLLSTEIFETGSSTVGKGLLIDRFLTEQGWHRLDNLVTGEKNIFLFQKRPFS
jgi:hypothetical protein